ncbi:hypothetical protein DMENIID0001_061030 [Sergentomyia squamirostris]
MIRDNLEEMRDSTESVESHEMQSSPNPSPHSIPQLPKPIIQRPVPSVSQTVPQLMDERDDISVDNLYLLENEYNYSYSDTEAEDVPSDEEQFDLKSNLASLIVEEGCSVEFTRKLLVILRKAGHEELPRTRETLIGTPREKIRTRVVSPGEYYHFGLENTLCKFNENSFLANIDIVLLNIGIDGVPLKGHQDAWPILASFCGHSSISPFLIGIYTYL